MAFVFIPASYGSPLGNPCKNSIHLCAKKKKKSRARNTASIGVISHGRGEPYSNEVKYSECQANLQELIAPQKSFFMLPCPSNMQLYFIPIFSKTFKII